MADDFVLTNPIDHTLNSTWPFEIRNVKKIAIGDGVRLYYAATAPATRYDGTAFASQDLGSIWIDSDDNKIHILTVITPTWTDWETIIEAMTLALTGALSVSLADATITLQNTDEENTDGGRQVKFIAKGEQDGSEVTTLGYIEFSHEGAADDEKGQFLIKLNDGDDADAPSKQPIGYQSTGKIDVANSLSVLDEDDMTSDDAECVPTQQSVKAFGTMVPAVTGAGAGYAGEASITFSNGLIFKHGYKVGIGEQTVDFSVDAVADFPTAIVSGQITPLYNSNTDLTSPRIKTLTTAEMTVHNGNIGTGFYWQAWGY